MGAVICTNICTNDKGYRLFPRSGYFFGGPVVFYKWISCLKIYDHAETYFHP
jgi:hypothetical protein